MKLGFICPGCVITGAADQIPDRIKALVFLDAFLLENGESFLDIVPLEAARAAGAWTIPAP